MENKKTQKLSIAALIISILPLATFIPALFNISLPDGEPVSYTHLRAHET